MLRRANPAPDCRPSRRETLRSRLRRPSMTGLIFGLLLAAVCAQLWFASAPLPLGGPNVLLAAAAVILAAGNALWRAGRRPLPEPAAVIPALVGEFRPLIPAMAAALLLLAWMTTVHLCHGIHDATRLAQTALGIGILFAVYRSVDRPRRVWLMIMAVVAATFVSALWGFAATFIGDPFLTVWLHIASVEGKYLDHILMYGRMAGLAVTAGTFAYQLAVAVPLAFAVLLYHPMGRGRESRRRIYDAALFVMLLTLVTAMVVNATRSALLGVLVAAVIIVLPSLKAPRLRRRLFCVIALTAVGLLAFFNPVFTAGDAAGSVSRLFHDGAGRLAAASPAVGNESGNSRILSISDRSAQSRIPMAVTALRYSVDYPLGTGIYSPDIAHLSWGRRIQIDLGSRVLNPDAAHLIEGLHPGTRQSILSGALPHNQFLALLVLYGFPGLVLFALFYALVLRSLFTPARKFVIPAPNTLLHCLAAAVAGAMVSYLIFGLLNPIGPFEDDWSYFYIIGLVFSLERIAAGRRYSAGRPLRRDLADCDIKPFAETHHPRGK